MGPSRFFISKGNLAAETDRVPVPTGDVSATGTAALGERSFTGKTPRLSERLRKDLENECVTKGAGLPN